MNSFNKIYPSKLLLLGEYGILLGGKAFSIPYPEFHASWTTQFIKDQELNLFLEFLKRKSELDTLLNLDLFEFELNNGLSLKSTIPFGYGLGSSGTVVAAVFDRYSNQKNLTIQELKLIFSSMESFFHGQSSGLDPLISYYNKSLVSDHDAIHFSEIEFKMDHPQYSIQLIDSGSRRNTQICVARFKELLQSESYLSRFKDLMLTQNSAAIDSLLQGDINSFINNWKKISLHSLELFEQFIPSHLITDWKQGIKTEQYYYKLCGAGAGGYFLKMNLLN